MLERATFNTLAVGVAVVLAFFVLAMLFGRYLASISRPIDVELVGSAEFGGGWAFARTADGERALLLFYGERPYELYPFGGEPGYIVEPQDAAALLDCLRDEDVRWSFR